MTRLKWSPQSQEDVEDLYETIWQENSAAAERMFDKIEASSSLILHPRLGPRQDEVMSGLRRLVVQPYLIFYKTQPDDDEGEVDTVEIVRVVHGHQELKDRLRR